MDLIAVPKLGVKGPTLTGDLDESLQNGRTSSILQYIFHCNHYFVSPPKDKQTQN